MDVLRRALFCTAYILVLACFYNSAASSAMDVPCNSPCLLVVTEKNIIALKYNNATIYPIISNLANGVTIDYHISLGYIFWSDAVNPPEPQNIKRSNLDGTNIKVLQNTPGTCFGLAVDWRSSQLYWTEYFSGTISVSDLDGNNKRELLSSLDQPRRIVLDLERGLMFWTAYNIGLIQKSTLNGFPIVTLVTSLPQGPLGIDLDRRNRLVFWVNRDLGTVECVDYDGNNRRLLYQDSIYTLYGVTFFSSYLFVSYGSSSGTSSGVLKLNAWNGAYRSSVPLPAGLGTAWALVSYDSSRQLPVIPCPLLPVPSNGTTLGCPALPLPSNSVRDGCTCTGNRTEYPYNTVCQFSCIDGYNTSGSGEQICQENGLWNGGEFSCEKIPSSSNPGKQDHSKADYLHSHSRRTQHILIALIGVIIFYVR